MSYTFEKNKLYNLLGKELVEVLKRYKAYIAGGTITSLFCNREINDIDIYFKCKEDAGEFIRYVIEDCNWIITHTKKATAFKYDDLICQVIHFDYFHTPEDIFKKFDFSVCMGAFDFDKEEFVLDEDFLKHNAQRILKFNENTAYPIISALRVQKYEDKQYNISKPEYLKVLLTCMSLKIENYEDLKNQLGGMYGVNYDKILKPKEDEEFNLSNIIERMSDLTVAEDYFKMPEKSELPDSIEDLVYKINGQKIKVFKHKDNYYKFVLDDFEYISEDSAKNKDIYEIVDMTEIIKPNHKFYKFVKKVDSRYISFYDSKFEYKIGKEVKPSNIGSFNAGIYCGLLANCSNFTNSNNEDAVLIELEMINKDDILDMGNFRLSKALVIREVPKEEYEQFIK